MDKNNYVQIDWKNIKPGDCFTLGTNPSDYVFNICLYRAEDGGMHVIRIESDISITHFLIASDFNKNNKWYRLKLGKRGFTYVTKATEKLPNAVTGKVE